MYPPVRPRSCAFSLVIGLAAIAGTCTPLRAGSSANEIAIERANRFLNRAVVARDVVSLMHFGNKYVGYQYQNTLQVKSSSGQLIPGEFALVYRYQWGDNGLTDVAFFFDAQGNLTELRDVRTNAIVNQPWMVADAAIQVVGQSIIEAFGNQMNSNDRQLVQRFVNNGDAKGLLLWSLKMRQLLGL